MILSVGLAAGTPANPEFTREFGWVPGINHSVVLETVRSGGIVGHRRPDAGDVPRALGPRDALDPLARHGPAPRAAGQVAGHSVCRQARRALAR